MPETSRSPEVHLNDLQSTSSRRQEGLRAISAARQTQGRNRRLQWLLMQWASAMSPHTPGGLRDGHLGMLRRCPCPRGSWGAGADWAAP